jgi:N-methylhydantoinase A
MRVISVERGHDPREFVLVAFGGGGPLHACAVARALRMDTVLIPAMPGALSAIGILLANAARDYSRTVMLPGSAIAELVDSFAELGQRAVIEFTAEGLHGIPHLNIDVRYRGQGYELNVPFHPESPDEAIDAFHRMHEQRFGFADRDKPLEIVNLRLRMIAAGEPYLPPETDLIRGDGREACYGERRIYFDGDFIASKVYDREALTPGSIIHGPAMITEYTSSTLLPPGCHAQVDGFGNLVITVAENSNA